eukprot:TRINITY_DN332_c0_g2_i4.p1 TRINITY_DN332_c0_g2~~TRINITY_DN332_c0_g2_i4.p1  ORF type:complete len:322 (-),score=29.85 TRINITY_DN332_c0_g2_i4:804-1769(-)
MFLEPKTQEAVLRRLNMSFGQLRKRLMDVRFDTRGLREVVALGADEQSVQTQQRKLLADLGHMLGLLVVKEVAVSTEYEFEGKKKGTYGAVDQVLISAQLKGAIRDETPYVFPRASSNFPRGKRSYTPPFPVLLAWESKSRERVKAYMKLARQRGKGKGKGKKGQSSGHGRQHRSVAPDGTPGKVRPDNSLQQDDLVHAGFYAKALREHNHNLYTGGNGQFGAIDQDSRHFLPVVISDSYTFVFEKRFLNNQHETVQVNMDTDADDITKMLLWALHHASELEKVYHPLRQPDNAARAGFVSSDVSSRRSRFRHPRGKGQKK